MSFEQLQAGAEVGIRKLKNLYDNYATHIFSAHRFIEPVQQERGKGGKRKPAKFRVQKTLPTEADYRTLRNDHYRQTVEDLVSEAYGDIQCLAEEMRDWHENMPENLQDGDVGCRVSEAADALENIDEPEIPESVKKVTVVYLPNLTNTGSRPSRAAEAAAQLYAAQQQIHDDNDDSEQELEQEVQEFCDQLIEHQEEVEAVDFPTMFG